MSDLPKGFIIKKPHPNAPDWVIASLSCKTEEAIETLKQNDKNGWSNYQILNSKEGKYYIKLDEWEPETRQNVDQGASVSTAPEDDDLPF